MLCILHICINGCVLLKFRCFFFLWLWKLSGQGGLSALTNSVSFVSESCCTLFAHRKNVFLPSKARLFSFLHLLLCLKYIILLSILTKKAGLSPSRAQECGNWILHLKVNFHNGITQISLSLFHTFASIHLSFILLHLDASLHLLWFTLFIWGHLFSCSTARLMFFHFGLLRCSWPTCVCMCVSAFSTAETTIIIRTPNPKSYYSSEILVVQCHLTIKSVSYLFISLSFHLV